MKYAFNVCDTVTTTNVKKAPTGLQNNCIINENKLPNKINAAVSTNPENPSQYAQDHWQRGLPFPR